ncbi:MAG TPA: biotin/lipoyl-binding protein, partial [Kofleriaceae bacterium]|nr:biotin/lipoyl-binding protein [Kofleriaceae bacterium]
MINNLLATARLVGLAAVLLAACQSEDLTTGRYQGMIELEQTALGFEVAGKLVSLRMVPGQDVKAGDVLAALDDTLDRGERAIRAQDLEVAKAELVLVEAGSRVEDVRAARAQLLAAKASEDMVGRQVTRERDLLLRGAVAAAHLDELEAQLAQAQSQRQTLEERVRLL